MKSDQIMDKNNKNISKIMTPTGRKEDMDSKSYRTNNKNKKRILEYTDKPKDPIESIKQSKIGQNK